MSHLSPQQKRAAARLMMDEDSSTNEIIASTSKVKYQRKATNKAHPQRPSTPPPSSRPQNRSASATSSPTLALKFDGKVYRTLPTQRGVSYSPSANFFGEPDELVSDLARERADARRAELEREMKQQRLTTKKRARSDSDEELFIKGSPGKGALSTPTKRTLPFANGPSPPKPRTPFELAGPSNAVPAPALGAPFALGNPFTQSTSTSASAELPKPLADLLALHNAIESVLLLHLAASGSLIASASSAGKQSADGTSTTVRMPSIIDLPDLAKKLSSGGKRCGETELARLVWAWAGCGRSEESDEDSDDGLTVTRNGKGLEPGEVGGMGFIVSRMRVNNGQGIVNTYGLGISVQLKTHIQRPKLELLPPPSPERSPARRARTTSAQSESPSSPGIGSGRDGMTVVALWSQGAGARRREFARRLKHWSAAREREPVVKTEHSSPGTVLSALRIPLAPLPQLAHAVPTIPGTPSPSPHKPKPAQGLTPGLTRPDVPSALASSGPASPRGAAAKVESDVFGPVIPIKGGIKGRKSAMMERLAAKAAARAPIATLPLSDGAKSLRRDKDSGTERRMAEMASLKKRSMLSRLPAVADVVWMMFEVGGGHKSNIRLLEVAEKVAKSAGAGTSEGEAKDALRMLVAICPDFVIKSVSQQEWLAWGRRWTLQEVKRALKEELSRSYPAAESAQEGQQQSAQLAVL